MYTMNLYSPKNLKMNKINLEIHYGKFTLVKEVEEKQFISLIISSFIVCYKGWNVLLNT